RDRDLDRIQAQERGGRSRAEASPVGVHALLGRLTAEPFTPRALARAGALLFSPPRSPGRSAFPSPPAGEGRPAALRPGRMGTPPGGAYGFGNLSHAEHRAGAQCDRDRAPRFRVVQL